MGEAPKLEQKELNEIIAMAKYYAKEEMRAQGQSEIGESQAIYEAMLKAHEAIRDLRYQVEFARYPLSSTEGAQLEALLTVQMKDLTRLIESEQMLTDIKNGGNTGLGIELDWIHHPAFNYKKEALLLIPSDRDNTLNVKFPELISKFPELGSHVRYREIYQILVLRPELYNMEFDWMCQNGHVFSAPLNTQLTNVDCLDCFPGIQILGTWCTNANHPGGIKTRFKREPSTRLICRTQGCNGKRIKIQSLGDGTNNLEVTTDAAKSVKNWYKYTVELDLEVHKEVAEILGQDFYNESKTDRVIEKLENKQMRVFRGNEVPN